MNIGLSEHFTYKKLLRFTFPSIIMMVFTSVYGVVDGLFISNYVGKTAFISVNFIMPVLMILGTLGFMIGAGGSALTAKTMGEGDFEKADRLFSLFIYLTIASGAVLAVIGYFLIPDIASLMGAEGEMLEYCILYSRIVLIALPFVMLQYEFQSFFIAAEKPNVGLIVTIVSGVANIILDALFTAVFDFGIVGAASATVISQVLGGGIPLVYFSLKRNGKLKLVKTIFDGRAILKACSNGSSELMSNISMSVVSMLYNSQLLHYAGSDGIAAYGAIMYVNMIFIAIFIGYSVGTAPVVSYHFGAENTEELKNIRKRSTVIIGITSVAMLIAAELSGGLLSQIFVGYDEGLLALTRRAFTIYSFSFFFSGIAIFGSSFFTALNDGFTSAVISFLRTLAFQVAAVKLLPLVMGVDGIWLSVVVAEGIAAIITVIFLIIKKKKYNY